MIKKITSIYRAIWLRVFKGATCSWQPKRTPEMVQASLVWALFSDEKGERFVWREICAFCGGNCGQCGITGRVGNVPFSMQRMIENLHNRNGSFK